LKYPVIATSTKPISIRGTSTRVTLTPAPSIEMISFERDIAVSE